ncbi:MAG: InlB B-repeat-containing protein [Clostridia bacterium]|nr:InlB B-repeat-containing protein [Clostridia bacterium]
MALTLVGTSACGLFGGGGADGKTYSVTLNLNGGSLADGDELTSYMSGEETLLPTPVKSGATFQGWFKSSDLSGGKVLKIYSGEKGDKEFWAKWSSGSSGEPSNPTGQTYTVTLNLNGGKLSQNLTSYKKGTGATLPAPTRDNYQFGGWYDNAEFNGTLITQISSTDTGNKEFWAKWTPTATGSLALSAYEGYSEGAFVEFAAQSGVSKYTVSYKKSGANAYTEIDDELIRVNGGKVRADIVGLAAGNYTVKVVAGSKSAEVPVTVTSYDRSGYAHFDSNGANKMVSAGVGAYNNDGTPKTNAKIIYLTEDNKNNIDGKGTSIAKYLASFKNNANTTPVIIRVVGTVGSATWNSKKYSGYGKSNPLTAEDFVNNTSGNGTLTLTKDSKKDYTQEQLIAGGFNTLNTRPAAYNGAECLPINGLNSKIMCRQDSKTKVWNYDSCWNDCTVTNMKNVTVEGIGKDAKIFQWGFTFKTCSSIEVRNIHFDDYTEDGCSFEGNDDSSKAEDLSGFPYGNVWLHHNTFDEGMNYWDVCDEQDKGDGDGSTDFKGVKNITIAYNHYIETHKTNLIGGGDGHATANVTFHHNYYESCNQRMPLGRQANMHMYNNYYSGSTLYSISLRAGAYAFIENCYFTEDASNHYPVELVKGSYGTPSAKIINCEIDENKVNKNNGVGADYLYIGSDRSRKMNNASTSSVTKQRFAPDFDTNSTLFYYENGQSKVTVMHTAEETKKLVPQLAGVLKK